MPTVRVRDNENFELSLRRFKRLCEKAGILADLRRHEFYEKPTWKRKRKKAAAVKRYQKKILREHMALERDRQPIGTGGGGGSNSGSSNSSGGHKKEAA